MTTKSIVSLFVFDLDGTLADGSHRLHHICNKDGSPKESRNWKAFFSETLNDKPIAHVIEVLHSIALRRHVLNTNDLIVILTARNSSCRADTQAWIAKHLSLNFNGQIIHPIDFLYMRPEENREQDDILKPRQLQVIVNDIEKNFDCQIDVRCIYEDRGRVVNAWRDMGYPCMQVASGDF